VRPGAVGLVCHYPMFFFAADLRPIMGDVKADTIVTMHVIVRAAAAGKLQGALLAHSLFACLFVCSLPW